MQDLIKRLLEDTSFYHPIRKFVFTIKQRFELRKWIAAGKPSPPPHIVKKQELLKLTKKYRPAIFVETGTLYGDTVEAMKKYFERVYSIELSDELYALAVKRFRHSSNVQIIHGDSGIELGKLMKVIDKPALFWLDGHYSGDKTARGNVDTPIMIELNHILSNNNISHIIVIDDARAFGTDPAYPTIDEVKKIVLSKCPNAKISIKTDSIRIIC